MIYVDAAGHMVTDGQIEELHAFAQLIGLRPIWFQEKHQHHDLTTTRIRARALANGARLVASKEIIRILRKRR